VPVAFLAAEMALRIGCGLQPGQTFLIPGVGGSVANAAIQLARIKGAGRIITSAGRTEKAEKAREMGFDDVIDLSKESLTDGVMRLTDGKGVEVALDSIGGDITGQALDSLASGGKVVHMGYPGGTSLTVDSMAFIWKPASIHGFNMYFQPPEQFGEAWQTILGLLTERRIKPLVGRTFPLEQAADATRYLIEERPMGKVVLTM
jgi:NADPH2:quinone reductase